MDDRLFLQVYKGKSQNKRSKKVIAFDLDETLGSFRELHILWGGLNQIRNVDYIVAQEEQDFFNALLDLYPEFLRDGILHILEYIYTKKLQGICDKIYIYTNNQCQPPWVSLISNYFSYKLGVNPLFDKNVCAFKIRNVHIESLRTSHKKTYADFIHCAVLPKTVEICFIDNALHPEMKNEKIYYIQPRAYYHSLGYVEILDRFFNSHIGKTFPHSLQSKPIFKPFHKGQPLSTNELQSHAQEEQNFDRVKEYLLDWFDFHGSEMDSKENPTEIHFFVAQKMLYHIKEYFYWQNRKQKTKKKRIHIGRSTRKVRKL